jgi:soluble lytic murein transglycosylase
MRGIGQSFSRLFSPKAIMAGAALFAGTAAPGLHADAQEKAISESTLSNQTAYAVPRSDPGSGTGVAFPEPLNPSDAALVRQIFTLHGRGQIDAAEQATSRLSNRILLGAILADRYASPHTKPSAADLTQWLDRYGDQPQAIPMLGLLRLRLKAKGSAAMPTFKALPFLGLPDPAAGADLDIGHSDRGIARQPGLDAQVTALAQAGRINKAVSVITSAKIDPLYGASLRAEVARAAFANDRNTTAASLARQAMQQSNGKLGLPAFVAGLAAWRRGDSGAVDLFANAANAPTASPELVAAASFWAARSALRAGQDMAYLSWMRRSAASGSGFYAMLARHSLGDDDATRGFNNQTLGLADLEAIAATPRGQRAFALLQVGQIKAAEAELRYLYPEVAQDAGMRRAIMLVAWQAGMATFASQIASLDPDRPAGSAVVIPPVSLFPGHGLHVDPALLYALVRVESNFDPTAVSGSGARGLLQLMPATADFMNKSGATRIKRRAAGLADPAYNLEMGQRYLNYLAGVSSIDGDLIRILASYNAGPSETDTWNNAEVAAHDPLLYIEMIPNQETRRFVFSVLRYSWAYAAQLHLPVPSLEALSEGQFPLMVTAMASKPTIH